MPYQWVEPKVVVEHNGVAVYHTYKDGEIASSYWYTLDPAKDDWEDEEAFDIRELNNYDPELTIVENLKAAIETGELKTAAE